MLVTTAIDRRQAQEGAVALVGLDHHPVAGAEPGVGAVGVDDAAVDHGRDRARRRRAARRSSRWSWSCRGCRRPRSTISAASARPASRRGAPPGQRARGRPATSGLSGFTADEIDDDLGVAEVVGAMADRDRDAELAQPARRWRCRRCRCPAPGSRGCAAPRRCRSCRCRRCRRNGSVPMIERQRPHAAAPAGEQCRRSARRPGRRAGAAASARGPRRGAAAAMAASRCGVAEQRRADGRPASRR